MKKKKRYTYQLTKEKHDRLLKILDKHGFKYGGKGNVSEMLESIVDDETIILNKKDLTNL